MIAMNDDDRAIIWGCDRTADCSAEVHASTCWRGFWIEMRNRLVAGWYEQRHPSSEPDLDDNREDT